MVTLNDHLSTAWKNSYIMPPTYDFQLNKYRKNLSKSDALTFGIYEKGKQSRHKKIIFKKVIELLFGAKLLGLRTHLHKNGTKISPF